MRMHCIHISSRPRALGIVVPFEDCDVWSSLLCSSGRPRRPFTMLQYLTLERCYLDVMRSPRRWQAMASARGASESLYLAHAISLIRWG